MPLQFLGRELQVFLIQRIRSTIASTISPIASAKTSSDRDPSREQPDSNSGFRRTQLRLLAKEIPGDPQPADAQQQDAHAHEGAPDRAARSSDVATEQTRAPSQLGPRPPFSALATFWDFVKRAIPTSRWLATSAYESALRRSKRTSSFRKGAILDHRAE